MIEKVMKHVDIEPRPYQIRITEKTLRMFDGTHRDRTGGILPAVGSVLIESPTGSGKTVMGLMAARYLQQTHGYRVGWVAMRRNLLLQAEAENACRGFDVDAKYISMFDRNPPQVDLLVVDEAQHDAAMSMANLHCKIRPKKILGLSATPYRTDRIKLCFEKAITDAGIHQLIQDGYLSRYHHYTIPDYRPETVARFYTREPDHWGQSLLFFHRLVQCEACRRSLARQGVKAEVVSAQSNRERQIAQFAEGKIQVLLSMAILAEGFDCPSLKTVFCRPSGKSCTIQMSGRVFRKHPDLPFKQVVQCKDTRYPFPRTATPVEQYAWMDGGWRTLKMNDRLAAISANSLRVIAKSSSQLPKLVVKRREQRGDYRFRSIQT